MTQFYQLSLEKAIADYQLGKLTTFGLVDYYIRIKFAPGWKIVIDPQTAIAELGITIHQFRRAIAKIRETISISLKTITQLVGEISVTPAVKDVTPSVNQVTSRVKDVTPSVNQVTPSANCDRQNTNKTSASSDSPDIRSNIDHISLSDKPKPKQGKIAQLPEEEREKFLNFAMDGVNKLPERPTLPSRYISSHFDELYSEFKLLSAPETQQATKNKQFDEWYDLMRRLGHAVGKKVKDGVQMVEGTGGYWSTYEEKSKFWKLDYLRKAVRGK